MLPLVAVLALAGPTFAKPVPWANGFAPAGSLAFAGDVNGDGFADLIRVHPSGDAFIDIAVNQQGMKSLVPQRANSNWGKDCQGACVANIDEQPGVDIVGLFKGDTLQLAHAFKDGTFKVEPEYIKLPSSLKTPHIAWTNDHLYVWDEGSGVGFKVAPKSKTAEAARLPKHVVRLDSVVSRGNHAALFTFADGKVSLGESPESGSDGELGKVEKGSVPAVANAWIFLDERATKTPNFVVERLESRYPGSPEAWAAGDMDNDGDEDLLEFRFGKEAHTGTNVLLHRRISANETDSDRDGISNEQEQKAGIDPFNSDSDGDGLLDSWETGEFRGLDMKALGCDPTRPDVICLISRFGNTKKETVDAAFKNITGYYDGLGWSIHPIFIEEVSDADMKRPWWELRDKFLPSKWRGVVHWMQVTPWGGGQADQLGDGGGCGGNEWSLYATFIHEFGHQLGLSHEGFYPAAWCPTYPSMMNYAYSYGYEDDIKKIRYSDGALKDFVMKETDLDEALPLPYDKVKFLERGPYHYRLKANGATTLIDWNWNGVFGEKHVRADINYAYSTTAGRRDEVGKVQAAPWTFVHNRNGYVLYAQQGVRADGKGDPSVLPDKPGWLLLRRLVKPFEWAEPIKVAEEGVTGDPVAISYKGELVVAYPSSKGVAVRWLKMNGDKVATNEITIVDDTASVPSLGIYKGRLFLFEWAPKEGYVRYRSLVKGHKFSEWAVALSAGAYPVVIKSTAAVSMAVDTLKDEVVLGLTEDQDAKTLNRWAIRRYKVRNGFLEPSTPKPNEVNSEREWVGGAAGKTRAIVLFDEKGLTGMKGRILFFGLGSTSIQTPWSCAYVAQTIADKSVNGGWMVKRFYDEWTQSRSAPGAAWFNEDILYAYRWADGSQGDRDNILHVSYNGTGIEDAVMGDFDDVAFIRDFGMRHSILYLRQ
jgi:hypothetical protein